MSDNGTVSSSAHAECLSAARVWASPAIDAVVEGAATGMWTWEEASDAIWGAIGRKAKQLREEVSTDA